MINGTEKNNSSNSKGGKFFSAFCSVFGTVGIVILILICIPITVPKFFGVQIYNVVSGSMEPNIPVGSIVYVKKADCSALEAGDVIAFNLNGMTITHRVIENDQSEQSIVTKGDANPEIDMEPVFYGSVIGKVIFNAPALGALSDFFTTLKGKIFLFCGLVAFFIIMMLGSGKKDKKPNENTSVDQDAKAVQDEKADTDTKADADTAAKKKKIFSTVRTIIFIIAGGALVGSLTYIIVTKIQYAKEESVHLEAAQEFTTENVIEKTDNTAPSTTKDEIVPPISVDFEALLAENEDIIGWIYCEDSKINYPILKDDNNDYYLHHNYLGEYTAAGSIFVECANSDGFIDSNTIIYGHHMADGSMFASLSKWANQQYFEEHPEMWILTPTQNYRVDLFSEYTTSAYSDSYYAILTPCQEMTDYLQRVYKKSNFKREIELEEDGHYIMLSTCAYSFEDARSVLHGKLVPVGGAN